MMTTTPTKMAATTIRSKLTLILNTIIRSPGCVADLDYNWQMFSHIFAISR